MLSSTLRRGPDARARDVAGRGPPDTVFSVFSPAVQCVRDGVYERGLEPRRRVFLLPYGRAKTLLTDWDTFVTPAICRSCAVHAEGGRGSSARSASRLTERVPESYRRLPCWYHQSSANAGQCPPASASARQLFWDEEGEVLSIDDEHTRAVFWLRPASRYSVWETGPGVAVSLSQRHDDMAVLCAFSIMLEEPATGAVIGSRRRR